MRRIVPWLLLIVLGWWVWTAAVDALNAPQPTDRGGLLEPRNTTTTDTASFTPKPRPPVTQTTTTVPEAPPGEEELVEEESVGEIEVVIAGLNLRDAPGRSSNVIAVVPRGTVLSVLSVQRGWYEVVTPRKERGFVGSGPQFVKVLEMED